MPSSDRAFPAIRSSSQEESSPLPKLASVKPCFPLASDGSRALIQASLEFASSSVQAIPETTSPVQEACQSHVADNFSRPRVSTAGIDTSSPSMKPATTSASPPEEASRPVE